MLQKVSAVTYIFISDTVCTKEQFQDFIEDCAKWMEGQCQGVAAQFCLRLTDVAQWETIYMFNYEDKLREDIFSAEAECGITAAGEVTIY